MQKACQRRKILFVAHSAALAGSQISCFNIIRRLDRARFAPVFAAAAEGPLLERIRQTGTPCYVIRQKGLLGNRLVRAYARLIRQERIDLVHLNSFLSHYKYPAMAAKALRRPLVWFVREDPLTKRSRELRKWMIHLADAIVINCANSAALMFPKQRPPNVHVLPNAIDTTEFFPSPCGLLREELGIEAGRKVIGTVGTLDERKGIIYLLEAIERLSAKRSDFFLVVVGGDRFPDDSHIRMLREYVRTYNLQEFVAFAGPRQNMPEITNCFDIGVLPTLWDATSRSVLEAMACGLPVAASHVGGISELVQDGRSGFLVPPRDPEALAAALIRLLDDEALRARFGQEGRRLCVENFSIERQMENLHRLYQDVLSGKASEGPSFDAGVPGPPR